MRVASLFGTNTYRKKVEDFTGMQKDWLKEQGMTQFRHWIIQSMNANMATSGIHMWQHEKKKKIMTSEIMHQWDMYNMWNYKWPYLAYNNSSMNNPPQKNSWHGCMEISSGCSKFSSHMCNDVNINDSRQLKLWNCFSSTQCQCQNVKGIMTKRKMIGKTQMQ